MNEKRSRDTRFVEIMGSVVDDSATDQELQELATLLRHHPELREIYVDMQAMHSLMEVEIASESCPLANPDAALRELLGEAVDTAMQQSGMSPALMEALELEQKARIKREADEALEKQQKESREAERQESMRMLAGLSKPDNKPQTRHYVIPKPLFYGSIAAAIAILAAIIWPLFQGGQVQPGGDPDQPTVVPIHFVAKMHSSIDAKWENGQTIADGQSLPQGKYDLISGAVKITYDSGAEVIIEGPAAFTLESDAALSLVTGKLAGHCPTVASRGFVVQTPNAKVTDLGTEFGVLLNEDGSAETHVFDGVIEVAPIVNGGLDAVRATRLTEGFARKIDRTGKNMKEITSRDLAVMRQQEFEANQLADSSPYHSWLAHSYKLRRDPRLVVYYPFDEESEKRNTLINRAERTSERLRGLFGTQAKVGSDPTWTGGRMEGKRSLSFAGQSRTSCVVVPNRQELNLTDAITISIWLRPRFDNTYGMAVISKRAGFNSTCNYQAAIMSVDSIDHPPGAIQFYSSKNANSDTDKLRFSKSAFTNNTQWAHIVVTANQQESCFYVDGKQVGKDTGVTFIADQADLIIGGANLSNVDWKIELGNSFSGEIDEIAIFDDVLTEDEIADLYHDDWQQH